MRFGRQKGNAAVSNQTMSMSNTVILTARDSNTFLIKWLRGNSRLPSFKCQAQSVECPYTRKRLACKIHMLAGLGGGWRVGCTKREKPLALLSRAFSKNHTRFNSGAQSRSHLGWRARHQTKFWCQAHFPLQSSGASQGTVKSLHSQRHRMQALAYAAQ
jgi:hypothetical protein